MGIRELSYFVAVAEHGNLTRAAAALHLSQPSLTAQLKRLERELGTDSFERVPRGVALTAAGDALLPLAHRGGRRRRADRAQRQRADEPGRRHAARRGDPSLSSALLLAALTAFHARHPRVGLEFVEARSEGLIARLERDELDLGLVILPIPHHAVQTVPVAEEDLVVVVGPDHPLASRARVGIADLDGVPFVVPRPGYTIWTTLFAARRHAGFEPLVVCDGGELSGVIALVARGLGAALIPSIVATQQAGLRTIRIDRPRLVRTIGLARRTGGRAGVCGNVRR